MCEDPDSQNRHLVLHVEDNRIGKSIVDNELSEGIPIQNVSSLTHFLC